MKHKCDHCNQPATNHSVEIVKGQKIVKHLCEQHAAQEAAQVVGTGGGKALQHKPVSELLTTFVKAQSGATSVDIACEECGLTFAQFKESSLLGCPTCYKAFEAPLNPLLERAHEGMNHHLGKVPRRAGTGEQRQAALQRMRKQLDEAVASEDYERAARLRDEIQRVEGLPT